MADGETILRVLITAPDRESLSNLLREQKPDVGCTAHHVDDRGVLHVEAYVPATQLEALRAYPVTIEVIEDATAKGRARQAEVGRDNPYEDRNVVPRGVGRKVKGDRP